MRDVSNAVRQPDELDDEDLFENSATDVQAARERPPETRQGMTIANQTFTGLQDYSNVTFTGPVRFDNVTFLGGFKFDGATFISTVRMKNVTVKVLGTGTTSSFRKCRFHRTASFSGSNIYGADFSDAVFDGRAAFASTRFSISAKFDRVRFNGPATFTSALFNGSGNFSGSQFLSTANFEGVDFRFHQTSHARFKGVHFGQMADFTGAHFAGHAEFTEAVFQGGSTFFGAQFCVANGDDGPSADDNTALTAPVVIAERRIDFSKATFIPSDQGELASFATCKFGDLSSPRDPLFQSCRFGNPKAKQKSPWFTVDFGSIRGTAGLSLRDAEFASAVLLSFPEASLEGDIDLSGAKFAGDIQIERAKARALILSGTYFNTVPDLQQSEFARTPRLHQAQFPKRLSVPKGITKPAILARLAALRELSRESNDRRTDTHLMMQELRLEGGVANFLYGAVSKYGQSWTRPVAWLLFFTLLAFPTALLIAHGRAPTMTELPAVAAAGGPKCHNEADGFAVAAAFEQSIRNALIVAAENEARQRRLSECLSGTQQSGSRTAVVTLLEATQTIVTAVFLFFIGGAIRRRLQMR